MTKIKTESRSATLNTLRANMALEWPLEWFPQGAHLIAGRRPVGR